MSTPPVGKSNITIYHNPRCGKSRQTLALLQEHGHEPRVVEYLKDVPDRDALKKVLKQLKLRPIDLCRTKEAVFNELNLADKAEDDEAIVQAMVDHPILIERPIVVVGNKAALGRPPEKVLEIL